LEEVILHYFIPLPFIKANKPASFRRLLCIFLLLVTTTSLTACGNKEKKSGQALVRVNGEEITVLQINDELSRAEVPADQRQAATKQLLASLIDRQLLTEEAMRNKIHRAPEVIQAIERAKANIIEQAYLESITSKIAKPSTAEINSYFQAHPEYFAERKQFDMQQVVIATRDITEELKSIIKTAKTLDAVVAWLNKHHVRYARNQLSRNSTDLPEQMVAKLKDMPKGQLFIFQEGGNSLLNSIFDVKNSPVTLQIATPQIEQYLNNKKSREAVAAEISHLRSQAKIEYLHDPAPAAH